MVEVRLRTSGIPALTLTFQAAHGSESDLQIMDRIHLRRGDHERVLDGSKPGATFNPMELSPMLELLGSTVKDALAENEGRLRIAFSNELVLEVTSTTGYEAWHFQYPRPGRPVGGLLDHPISLHGTAGRLI